MKRLVAKVTSMALLFSLILTLIYGGWGTGAVYAAGVTLTGSGGGNEAVYAEWSPVSNASGYKVFVKAASAADSQYQQLPNELIRKYASYWRADAVGLAAGSYVMKIEAVLSGGERLIQLRVR